MRVPIKKRISRAHELAHEHLSEDRPALRTIRMLAALVTTFLGSARLLGFAGDQVLSSQYALLVVAAALVLLPEVVKFAVLLYHFIKYMVVSESVKVNNYWNPVEDTLDLYYKERDSSDYPIGSVLEVIQPINLTKRLDRNGWAPEDICLRLAGNRIVDADLSQALEEKIAVLRESGELKEPNNPKYCVLKFPDPFKDSLAKPVIDIGITNYFETAAASRLLFCDKTLRKSFVSTQPHRNRVPHAICLHALCEFSDRRILLSKRHKRAWYYPDAFSASFEEQLSEDDFEDGGENAVAKMVHRAICEELFPVANLYEESNVLGWNLINDYIEFCRVWSFFLEHEIGNFSVFGHVSLGIASHEYCGVFRLIKGVYQGKRDKEGRLFVLDFDKVKELLRGDRPLAQEILVDEVGDSNIFGEFREVEELHPTSRYRLLTWATAKGLMDY